MKKFFILMLFLSGCGSFTTGEGVFKGRLVDVEWGGLFFHSCEAQFQFGTQSSSISSGSSLDKRFCDELKKSVGEIVQVKYKTWVLPCCLRTDTHFEIFKE